MSGDPRPVEVGAQFGLKKERDMMQPANESTQQTKVLVGEHWWMQPFHFCRCIFTLIGYMVV
jgi:hypothetical protein